LHRYQLTLIFQPFLCFARAIDITIAAIFRTKSAGKAAVKIRELSQQGEGFDPAHYDSRQLQL
jgi:hypothetical protein